MNENNQNLGQSIYVNKGPIYSGNVVGQFLNNWYPIIMNKLPNHMFEGCDGNKVVVCAIKSIDACKEILID